MSDYAIYIHIPFCKARCGYCAFSSCTDASLQQKYFDALSEEIGRAEVYERRISTIYLGGGTPSSVPAKYIERLFDNLAAKFDLSAVSEITAECNPESATEEVLSCFRNCGVNRLSVGLQSVNDDTLRRAGRIHTYADFTSALDRALGMGFNVNADVIIGLPESVEDFRRTAATVADLPLQHVSAYALELHEGTAMWNRYPNGTGFSDDDLADMYDLMMSQLERRGFCRYEVSNFAKAGFACRHNLNYWREGRYYGFGAAAHGFVGDVRYGNVFDVAGYISAVQKGNCVAMSENVSLSQQAEEYVMLGLRLDDGIDLEGFSRLFGLDFFDMFPNVYRLAEQGFLTVDSTSVRVPKSKTYVLNSILVELLG